MRVNPFESQLERLARTLTDQFGVQVVCQGDEAWTDGRQIVLPSLPEPMGGPLERMIVGFLDHEMAHVAFSDFKVVKEFSKKHPGREAMLNVVEDALIEKRAMQRWPGVRANLDAMFAQIRGKVMVLVAQRCPFDRFCTAIYLKLAHYGDMLGLDAELAGYEDLLDEFAAVRTTQDSAVLSERLLDRWLKNHPQAEDANPPPIDSPKKPESHASELNSESKPNDAPNKHGKEPEPNQVPDSDPKSSGVDESSNESGQDGKSDEDACSNHPGSTQSDEPGAEKQPHAEGIPSPQGRGGSSTITQALAEAIAEQVAALDSQKEYRVYTKQFDYIDVVPVANDNDVQEMLKKHVDIIRRLRRGLANALRSAEKRWWRDGQLRGDLSSRSLHRLCLDRPQLDVFRTRSEVQGQSTAVSIVLDASGSMTTNKMEVARDALRVLLEALDELYVATEAITFTTGNSSGVADLIRKFGHDAGALRQRFSRVFNLEIGLVKQFGESIKSALRRLPRIRGTGLTPLGEAMLIGAKRLVPRRESRRILLVLTDGHAGCESNDQSAVIHAQRVAKQIEAAGIELIGVGILDESLRAIVGDTIVVHQLEELPAQLCKLLSGALRKGLRHVG